MKRGLAMKQGLVSGPSTATREKRSSDPEMLEEEAYTLPH